MVVDRTRAQFVAEIDGWNLELLRQTYKHVDAMFEAWGPFLTWLHNKERLKSFERQIRRPLIPSRHFKEVRGVGFSKGSMAFFEPTNSFETGF